MNWLTKLFSTGATQMISGVMGSVERFAAGHLGKKELQLEIEKMVHERDMKTIDLTTAEITSKEKIMVAELEQGDSFTKRARPSIVYTGLIGAIIDAIEVIPFTMSDQFWYVWGGVCGVYVISRTVDKRKPNGKIGKIASMLGG